MNVLDCLKRLWLQILASDEKLRFLFRRLNEDVDAL
jgi:hypothetical protein